MLESIQNGLSKAFGAVNKGLNVFRGDIAYDSAPTVQVQGVTTPAAAIALGNWIPALLEANDFTSGRWISGDWSVVGAFKIEKDVRYRLLAGQPIRFFVKALFKESFAAVGAATTENTLIADLVNSKQADPTLPSFYHPEVTVWHRVAGAWQRSEINSITYELDGMGGIVDYDVPVGATEREIYYVHGNGEFRLRAENVLGGVDNSSAMLWNDSFMSIHSTDQNDVNTCPKFPRDEELVYGQRLVLEVRTTVEVAFNERARHLMIFKAAGMQIMALDGRALRAAAEVQNRAGV
jgi:hypothetical protein